MIRATATRFMWIVLWAHVGWTAGYFWSRSHDPAVMYAASVALLIVGVILADVLWLPQIAGSLGMRMRGLRGVGTMPVGQRSAAILAPEVDQPTRVAGTVPVVAARAPEIVTAEAPATPAYVLPASFPSVPLASGAPPLAAESRPGDAAALVPPRPPSVAPVASGEIPAARVNPPPGFTVGMTLVRRVDGKVEGKIIELDPKRKIARVDIGQWVLDGWQGVEAIPPEFIDTSLPGTRGG